ncbi:MAG TPA: LPS assembly lipoprotein LptE [Steroidobacteraceae bacterium]|jgi:LPS-assembly lipoprotein|nr:LPS assembly lipoprotein LptE [Steroidobacteraceae bacterium]
MRRLPFAAAALALLAGCGFHLRGQVPLPAAVASPYIETDDHYTPLYAALDERLRAAGAMPAADAASASAVIRLHLDETGRDLLSVTADNKPGEYEVYYAAEFSVANGATELLERKQVRLTRDYGYDESAVLAKEHEEESLRVALAGEIADLILRRLAAL